MRALPQTLLLGILLLGLSVAVLSTAPSNAAGAKDGFVHSTQEASKTMRNTTVATALRRIAGMAIIIVAAVVVLFPLLVLLMEKRLVYHPTSAPAVSWDLPWLQVEDCAFRTADGRRLHGWWRAAAGPKGERKPPVILWCHGNAGNITHRAENLELMSRNGLSALLYDYRGYGKSEGRPSEKGLCLDAQAAYDYLRNERGVEAGRIICFGRSLGAGVALQLAVSRDVGGLVMESTFESIPAMARKMFPLTPIWSLTRNRYNNLEKISGLQAPLLMIQGGKDTLTPAAQARAVYEAAPEPKQFYLVEQAGHDDAYAVGGQRYWDVFAGFCRKCSGGEFALER